MDPKRVVIKRVLAGTASANANFYRSAAGASTAQKLAATTQPESAAIHRNKLIYMNLLEEAARMLASCATLFPPGYIASAAAMAFEMPQSP